MEPKTNKKTKDITTLKRLTKKIKLSRQHVQVLLSEMAFELHLKFTERLYLCASTVYSKATLVLSSFHKRRTQQVMASGVVAMNLVRVPKLRK